MAENDIKNTIRKTLNELEQFTIDVIYDKKKTTIAKIYGYFLKSLSYIFSIIVQLRYSLYKNRIFRDAPLGCLVVIVGNLTVGGTGKTPVVEKFAKELEKRGRKVAILSRGYKSKDEPSSNKFWRWLTSGEFPKPKVVSDGKNILLDSEHAGDEPYMLAKNLKGVIVLVDKNRVRAGHYAITEFGADTLILDDGFQYLPLRGHMQLLLIDKTNPFGNLSLLPRGILREPLKHLKRASYIFLTKSNGIRDENLESLIRTHNATAEIIECSHTTKFITNFHTGKETEINILKGKRVACFCAIAAPDSFEKFLTKCGAVLVYKQRFLDHHRFDEIELEDFFVEAKEHDAEFVVTTEKDAVRINQNYKTHIPFYYTKLEIEILSGSGDFSAAVQRICFPSSK